MNNKNKNRIFNIGDRVVCVDDTFESYIKKGDKFVVSHTLFNIIHCIELEGIPREHFASFKFCLDRASKLSEILKDI
jgi:hypothetical protein